MKVTTQRLPESQVLLEVEVDAEQMERSLERAYRRLADKVEVPGFRKGKTPRNMLERHIGRERIVQEAIDILLPEAYSQAIDEQAIDPIDRPLVEVTSEEPLAFKATVPVRPTVELGDYTKLKVEREDASVDEADVDAAIEELRARYAIHQPVERPVQRGDIVTAEIRIVIDGTEVFKDEDAQFRLREGATVLLPGLAEGLAGAEKGVAREIEVTVPEGERPLSGKTGIATVTVKEVKEEVLPELDDSFAQQAGEGFPTLEALRERLRNDLRERLEAQAEERFRDAAVAALADNAVTLEYPPVLVEREIEHFLQDQARQLGQDVDRYLELIRKTREQAAEELRPAATERVRRSLALTRFTEAENVSVTPAEIDAEVERMAASAGEQGEQLRAMLSSADARAAIERSLLTRKTVDRLLELVSANGTGKQRKKKVETAKPAEGSTEE